MKKAIILSSGGVDSTTCLSVAIDELGAENVSTASIFYGQKHARELEAAHTSTPCPLHVFLSVPHSRYAQFHVSIPPIKRNPNIS